MKIRALFIVLCIVMVSSGVVGKVVEKDTVRYFQFEQSEYPLDADGRLSDTNAREILRRLKIIYEAGPPSSADGYMDLCDLRDNLHRVYSGEAYEEIMFTCTKIFLNHVLFLFKPPTVTSSVATGGNAEFYCGQILIITERSAGLFDGRASWAFNDNFNVGVCSRGLFFGVKSCSSSLNFVRLSDLSSPLSGGSYYLKDDSEKYGNLAINKFKNEQTQELLRQCTAELVDSTKKFIETIYNNGNHRSVIFEEQWDKLLSQVPVVFYNSKDQGNDGFYNFICQKTAEQLTAVCLSYMTNETSRRSLMDFADQTRLEYIKPMPKAEKVF